MEKRKLVEKEENRFCFYKSISIPFMETKTPFLLTILLSGWIFGSDCNAQSHTAAPTGGEQVKMCTCPAICVHCFSPLRGTAEGTAAPRAPSNRKHSPASPAQTR